MALIDSNEELGSVSEIDAEDFKQESSNARQTQQPSEQPQEIPEKYKGKNLEDIVRMHQEAEKLIGRQAQEVGEVRRLADDLIKQSLSQKNQQAQPQAAPPQQQVPQQQAAPDPKLEKWLGKNQWFGQDRLMTRAAQAIHEQLVLEEDFDPTSDDYYKEIDSRMRKEMPNKFQGKRSNAQTVAPASGNGRSVKSGRKKAVELTPGQVAFAKKMRIPLDKYAKEVAKLENRSQ